MNRATGETDSMMRCALAFLAKHLPGEEIVWQYAAYFILPSFVLFWIFFIVLSTVQIKASAKGFTPYPKWCWVFSMPVGMAAVLLLNVFGNQPFVNVLSCAWLSVGNIWMFGGLLVMLKKVKK